MLESNNAVSQIVKEPDIKKAVVEETTARTEEGTKETVELYIPRNDGNLPFYQDFFALARLLKDYSQYKTTGNRLPWDRHILSDASFAHAFCDLDKKLFGDFEELFFISELSGILPEFANSFKLWIGDPYKVVTGLPCIAPHKFRANVNSLLGMFLKKNKSATSDKVVSTCYKKLERLTERTSEGAYLDLTVRDVTNVFFEILSRIKRDNDNAETNGLVYSLGQYLSMVCIDDIIAAMRDYYFAKAYNKIKQLPCGETVLYHCGLGPKPKKLNYTGLKFGDVTVEAHTTLTRYEGNRLVTRDAVKARCVCSKVIKVAIVDLLHGKVTSCGNCNRPKTMPKATVARWASATLQNCKDNTSARASRRPYRFSSPEEVLYFAGIRRPGHDLGRIDDHLPDYDPPYAPGHVFWEAEAVNSAVETKSLTTSSQLNQVVMLERLPERGIKPAEIDPFSALDDPNAPTEIDDLL